eukprot:CAMPEP_0184545554 /NCGR_PEP_ID=MMETSP0199_2-20130426/4377_1 /TAXON_ID=1112570 /ORGANISM="Thraustochytrium sp., Strain LLF1b" /LENGTH=948 /DNA_ID=CAMNT_0026939861 /DNA_START=32 /DNA_END=2878 /DNA_ORIENTATION=-
MRLVFVTALACVLGISEAVDRSKFRTCAQSGFCARHRNSGADHGWALDPASLKEDGHRVVATLSGGGSEEQWLQASFEAFEPGVLRVKATEAESLGLPPRYESPDILVDDVEARRTTLKLESQDEEGFTVAALDGSVRARVLLKPFKVDVLDGQSERVLASINKRGLMHFERRRQAPVQQGQKGQKESSTQEEEEDEREIVDWGEDGKPIYADGTEPSEELDVNTEELEPKAFETEAPESFGGHTDHKPHGHTSVGIDVTFPGSKYVYGLPEHATDFALKNTKGGGANAYDEPFRMYNLDVFEYEIDEAMALYGHIPMVVAHNAEATKSFFWNNPSETFVDVTQDAEGSREVHWISESGVMDIIFSVGPTPAKAFAQYAAMTGTTDIPPMFSLGYHQCRWNYIDDKDVREVHAKFEEHDLPYDVLWLDIEHTDGKRYFTWDHDKFTHPIPMQEHLAHYGRKMVSIVDPHIKRDNKYYIHTEATAKGLYIKDKSGTKDFNGWCWPGDSSYLDFTHPKVRSWWADQFSFEKYKGSTASLFTWNDMNEPSVFNGPEVTMHKESLSLDGVEHREWHNLYGFYQHMATAEGLVRRTEGNTGAPSRSFVLSRAFFAGSQRHGAIWTGDNTAEWSHLKIASDMLLSLNTAGLAFAGADVGGFFGDPDTELLERWYQAGSFQPFFRAHAHIDTKRREPWLFGEEVLGRIAKTIKTRYSLLPLWYTLFHQHESNGQPVMRPMWYLTPQDERTFGLGDQWLVGSELLVKPVTDAGITSASVYLPKDTAWYAFESPHAYHEGGADVTVDAPLDSIPVFQRAGTIIPRKMRLRRSSATMTNDPYTLYVAVDKASGRAEGQLYIDDESTLAYKSGDYCLVDITFENSKLSATPVTDTRCNLEVLRARLVVERVVVLGLDTSVNKVVTTQDQSLEFTDSSGVLTIRKPRHSFIGVPFSLSIE